MNEASDPARSKAFKIGFGIVLFLIGGNVLGHIGLLIFDTEGAPTVFMAWSIFSLLATVILLVPYRATRWWAWYVICAAIVPYVLVGLSKEVFAPVYLGEAIAMAIGQGLTCRTFFA